MGEIKSYIVSAAGANTAPSDAPTSGPDAIGHVTVTMYSYNADDHQFQVRFPSDDPEERQQFADLVKQALASGLDEFM
jgi:hypothetical protein